jgi:hypothetical protein
MGHVVQMSQHRTQGAYVRRPAESFPEDLHPCWTEGVSCHRSGRASSAFTSASSNNRHQPFVRHHFKGHLAGLHTGDSVARTQADSSCATQSRERSQATSGAASSPLVAEPQPRDIVNQFSGAQLSMAMATCFSLRAPALPACKPGRPRRLIRSAGTTHADSYGPDPQGSSATIWHAPVNRGSRSSVPLCPSSVQCLTRLRAIPTGA